MKKMRRCEKCEEYTLEEKHCGSLTQSAYPPKFSLHDKYAEYRKAKQ